MIFTNKTGQVRFGRKYAETGNKNPANIVLTGLISDPGGTRTHNHQNRNLAFYPIELRDQKGKRVGVQV